jgi:SOS-response transcriptional repressor LexA
VAKISALTGIDMAALVAADFAAAQHGPSLFVKGEVAAGVWKQAMEWDRTDWVAYQGGSHISAPIEARFGLIVAGESMNEVYPPGTVLDCVSCLHAGIEEVKSGQRVIVVRTRVDGEVEATVKEYQETPEGVWLVPKSRNPAYQQPIPLTTADPDIAETRIIAVVRGSYRPEP